MAGGDTDQRCARPGAGGPRPYRETLRVTLRRTLTITFFITTAISLTPLRGGPYWWFWVSTYAAVLWFPLGGHYVELVYLNFLRMRWAWFLRRRYLGRVGWWLAGGLPLGLGCWWTWGLLGTRPDFDLPFWWGMPFFVLTECLAHTVLSILGRPSFWNGRE